MLTGKVFDKRAGGILLKDEGRKYLYRKWIIVLKQQLIIKIGGKCHTDD